MSAAVIRALALTEVRLRMRRLSTMVALLAVVAISWLMIADPSSGRTLLVIGTARAIYTSSTLALGSASLAGILFGLAGFYLVRGRVGEDIRSGIGSVIAASPVGNGLFLFSRWLGGVAYLAVLIIAFMGTVLVCHAVRGDGPIELAVYLQTYALALLPLVAWTVGCAILFDSWTPLMGKGGDVLYFFIWTAQIALMALAGKQAGSYAGHVAPMMLFDFSGLGVMTMGVSAYVDTTSMTIGGGSFDPKAAGLLLPTWLWSSQMVLMRVATGVLALLPLLPAVWLFHRFSPDRVKLSGGRKRRSPLDLLNNWLRPLARAVAPLFALAARLPGWLGQALADVALTLAASPSAIAALVAAFGASLFADAPALGPVLLACVAFWGILVSDISTRDFAAAAEEMTGAVAGGVERRYLRQLAATLLLGVMFMGVIAVRWAFGDVVRACAVVAGIFSLGALASLLGRCSRTPRTFMALFLFGLYVAVNAARFPMIDVVGFNGVANLQSVLTQVAIGIAAVAAGYSWNRRRA